MKRVNHPFLALGLSMVLLIIGMSSVSAQVSDQPGTPFKLATFEATGTIRIGMSVQDKLMDLHEANSYVSKQLNLSVVSIPKEMRALIEQYDAIVDANRSRASSS